MPLPQNSHTIQIRLEAASLRKVNFFLNESQCDVCLLCMCKRSLKIVRSISAHIFGDPGDLVVRLLHKPRNQESLSINEKIVEQI